ncbi:MAG TPA: FAD-binding protein [Polyangiaceae bacterium]
MQRRQFLSTLAAAATVVGFNPTSRTWVTEAAASTGVFSHVPTLDGQLLLDTASLAARSTDAGNLVHKTPAAVLRPGSLDDVVKMVRFCNRYGINVAARGQAHTTFGQGLVEGGLIIDTSTLNTIHSIGANGAQVDAGVLWKDLTEQAFAQGLTPPVLTGFLGLSVGGTLSVGGISSGNVHGAQVDHVQELQVVTGSGDLVRCSPRNNSELFEAVLAGLGQCGIIVRATLDLVPVKPLGRVFLLNYVDNATFFSDLRLLLDRGEFDYVFNIWVPGSSGGFVYQLNAVKFFDPAAPPDNAHLLRGLHFDPASDPPQDVPYLGYVTAVDAAIAFFQSIGLWSDVIHPWFDMFIPGRAIEHFVADVLPTLTPEDIGMTGFFLLFPLKRSKFGLPQLRLPHDEWIFLFDILTANSKAGPDPVFADKMLKRNRRLFEQARALGGTRYPIGSIPFTRIDWLLHYGERYLAFAEAKHRFDPAGILTPGVNIF